MTQKRPPPSPLRQKISDDTPIGPSPVRFGRLLCKKLMFGALIRAAERWRSVKVTEFERRQMAAVRKDLDQEYEATVGLNAKLSKDDVHVRISSNPRT